MSVAEKTAKVRADSSASHQDRVLAAFGEVFKETPVTAQDDFFDLGGDSLLAEELAMRLTEIAGREVRISALFDYPTPEAMSAFLDRGEARAATVVSEHPPIFMVHGGSGYTMPKPKFFEGLAPGQRLELFQLPGFLGDAPIPDNVPDIAAAYVGQIERDWPEGRIHLGAFCDGALIAVEMARQLDVRGRRVDHMVLLDPGVPKIIGRVHRGIPARLRSRIGFALITGRFSGGQSLEDIHDDRLRKTRGRLVHLEARLRRLRSRLTGHHAERFHRGKNLLAESRLAVAWNHFWPTPYEGAVDIICSEERRHVHEDETSFWRMVLPNMRIWTVIEKHEEVTGAESPITSEKMQALFDESEGR